MDTIVLLVGFCLLLLIVRQWFIFNNRSRTQPRYQPKNRVFEQPTPTLKSPNKVAELLQPTEPELSTFDKNTKVIERRVVPKKRSPTSRVKNRHRSNKHHQNIHYSYFVVQQLRSEARLAKLPAAIAKLRRLEPYVFEELLLTCCKDQGW